MNLKSLLKSIKLNESTISMLLGAVVIVVVGVLVVNYFRGIDTENAVPTVETPANDTGKVALPTTHVVAEGEDLWTISEKYYDSGYNWVDIAEANELSSPGNIAVGQELTIPNVDSKTIGNELADKSENTEATQTVTPEPTVNEKLSKNTAETNGQETQESVDHDKAITGDTYTVVRGDSLWSIAQRAYGDGNRWVDIARANNLANPRIIHAGNVFTLPR